LKLQRWKRVLRRLILALETESQLEPTDRKLASRGRLVNQVATKVRGDRVQRSSAHHRRPPDGDRRRQLGQHLLQDLRRLGQPRLGYPAAKARQRALERLVHEAAPRDRVGLGIEAVGLQLSLD
jgi:hypothetical protein